MKEVKVPPPTPPCMSIVDRLCSTLAENFNSTDHISLQVEETSYLLRGHFLQPSFCPYTIMEKNTFFWILRMEFFYFSPIGSTLEAKARRCNQPTNPANTFLFPRCQMRTFFVAYFFLVPNTYIFPWPTTHLLFICVTFDIKS